MKSFFLRRARDNDVEAVLSLLTTGKLPVEGVREAFGDFVVAEGRGVAVGAVGMEVYGRYALLRSAIVEPGWQGYGIGRALVAELISRARTRSIDAVYLLTTTAENYFPAFGFERIDRAAIPEELAESAELRGACPDSAIAMKLGLR